MNVYRTACETHLFWVTMNTALNVGPYAFCSNTTSVRARDEEEAVQKVFKELESQGYDVLACTDVHRAVTPNGGVSGGT